MLTHIDLLSQATKAMDDWQSAQTILGSPDQQQIIELTIIAATGIPKPRIGQSSLMMKVVFLGTNTLGKPSRQLHLDTDFARNTQSPVWNKRFSIEVPRNPKMFIVEVYDRNNMGMLKEIARVKLSFTFTPGAEISFEGRSLVYGLDGKLTHWKYNRTTLLTGT